MMDEIGYEDCDYVSFESLASRWIQSFAMWQCVKFESQFTCTDYMERMSTMLQTRFKVVENFRQLHTNTPRNMPLYAPIQRA